MTPVFSCSYIVCLSICLPACLPVCLLHLGLCLLCMTDLLYPICRCLSTHPGLPCIMGASSKLPLHQLVCLLLICKSQLRPKHCLWPCILHSASTSCSVPANCAMALLRRTSARVSSTNHTACLPQFTLYICCCAFQLMLPDCLKHQ